MNESSRDVLAAAISTGKYSKTWVTNKLHQLQDHERNMALIKAFRADPELKYYMGVAGGAAAGATGALVSRLLGESPQRDKEDGTLVWIRGPDLTGTPGETIQATASDGSTYEATVPSSGKVPNWVQVPLREAYHQAPDLTPFMWLSPGAMLTAQQATFFASVGGNRDPTTGEVVGGGNMFDIAGDALAMAGLGFAGFCAAVLILKAIFSGTDLGELLSGVGEIVPL